MHKIEVKTIHVGCVLVRQWLNNEERVDLVLADNGELVTSTFVLREGYGLVAPFSLGDTLPDILDGHTYYSGPGSAQTRSAWKSSLMHKSLLDALEECESFEEACRILKALREIFPEERQRNQRLIKTQTI